MMQYPNDAVFTLRLQRYCNTEKFCAKKSQKKHVKNHVFYTFSCSGGDLLFNGAAGIVNAASFRSSPTSDALGLIGDGLITREEWSEQLRINRTTIYRWEKEVIEKCVIRLDYWKGRKGKKGLDEFQRFVTALIYLKKTIGITQTNQEIIDWFEERVNGTPRIFTMRRHQFYNFRSNTNEPR